MIMTGYCFFVVALLLVATPLISAQSSWCTDCQLVVAKLESLLNDTQNEEAIIQKLDKVCTYVPPEQQALCATLIDKYVPALVNWIVTNERPEVACTQIDLCPQRSTILKSNTTTTCTVCEIFVAAVELLLATGDNNATEQEILNDLNGFCNISFLQKYKLECEFFIETDADTVVKEVFKGDSGEEVCSSTLPPICSSSQKLNRNIHKKKHPKQKGAPHHDRNVHH